jgi:hypothetical protein
MNLFSDINYDYQRFLNGGLPNAASPVSGPFPGGIMMLPAPEDQPFRPAFFLVKEDIQRYIEATVVCILLFLAIVFRKWWIWGLFVVMLAFVAKIYVSCHLDVAKHYRDEKLRWQGKLVPGPNAQQLYVVHNMLA